MKIVCMYFCAKKQKKVELLGVYLSFLATTLLAKLLPKLFQEKYLLSPYPTIRKPILQIFGTHEK